jgi:hypothetical protein
MKQYVLCMCPVYTSLSSAAHFSFSLVRLTFKVWSIRLSKKVHYFYAANKNSRNKAAEVDAVSNSNSTVACVFVVAGTCIPIRCLETGCIKPEVMTSHATVSWHGAEGSCMASFIPPEDSSLSVLSHLSGTSFPTSRILLLPLGILNFTPFSPFHPPLTHSAAGSFSESLQLKKHCAIAKNTHCCGFW